MNALKVVIINKSDSTGGAAVVSFRLMNALRTAGVDARMLVAEKLTDSPFVEGAGKPWQLKCSFLAERLKIFLANGLNRKTLFKIDTGSDGVPLHKHPAVMEADVMPQLGEPGVALAQRGGENHGPRQAGGMDHARHVEHDRHLPSCGPVRPLQ